MNLGAWVPLGALTVSLATLVFAVMTQRGKAQGERLKETEARMARCRADRADLRQQLFQTMTDLIELQRAETKKPVKK